MLMNLLPCIVESPAATPRRRRSRDAPARARLTLLLAGLLNLIALGGCGKTNSDEAPATAENSSGTSAAEGPPGFLDPAPPPPESDTLILSGGTLLAHQSQEASAESFAEAFAEANPTGLFDAIVVVRDGVLLGYGRRGAIDVPADSIGIDTSGQFIEPVGALTVGTPVTLNVYRARPQPGAAPPPLTGRFAAGRWQPVANDGR